LSGIGKLAVRRVHTGDFKVDQQQRLAQAAAVVTNSHRDMLLALVNRSYVELTTDFTQAGTATYATLLTANITTVLATGYIITTFSVSGVQLTNASAEVFQVTVDGVATKGCYQSTILNGAFSAAMVIRTAVTRGPHVVRLQSKVNNNTMRISAATVNEEHAHMLVQEAA